MTNINNIKNTKIPYIDRAVTFDGPENKSRLSNIQINNIENFVSNLLYTRIVESCRKICACINSSRKQKLFVKRLSLLFKVDQDYKLALILCTNLKAEDLREKKSYRAFTRHVDTVIWESKFKVLESTERLTDKKQFNAKIAEIFSSTSKLKPSPFKNKNCCVYCNRILITRNSNQFKSFNTLRRRLYESPANRTIDLSSKPIPRM